MFAYRLPPPRPLLSLAARARARALPQAFPLAGKTAKVSLNGERLRQNGMALREAPQWLELPCHAANGDEAALESRKFPAATVSGPAASFGVAFFGFGSLHDSQVPGIIGGANRIMVFRLPTALVTNPTHFLGRGVMPAFRAPSERKGFVPGGTDC